MTTAVSRNQPNADGDSIKSGVAIISSAGGRYVSFLLHFWRFRLESVKGWPLCSREAHSSLRVPASVLFWSDSELQNQAGNQWRRHSGKAEVLLKAGEKALEKLYLILLKHRRGDFSVSAPQKRQNQPGLAETCRCDICSKAPFIRSVQRGHSRRAGYMNVSSPATRGFQQ